MNVQVGATVTNGQKIGNVGATGNVTGEHVHIGLLYKGKLVDPHPFVTGVWDFDTKAAELEGTTITYYVQVGAFANRTYADNYAAEVRSKGFDAFVRVYSGETYPYRVQCGAFTLYDNAETTKINLSLLESMPLQLRIDLKSLLEQFEKLPPRQLSNCSSIYPLQDIGSVMSYVFPSPSSC